MAKVELQFGELGGGGKDIAYTNSSTAYTVSLSPSTWTNTNISVSGVDGIYVYLSSNARFMALANVESGAITDKFGFYVDIKIENGYIYAYQNVSSSAANYSVYTYTV